MEIALGVIALLGLGANLWSNLSGAAEREEAARKNLELSNMAADEYERRFKINEQIAKEEMSTILAASGTAGAARGGGAQLSVGDYIKANRVMSRNLDLARQDAEYKVKMMRLGATYDFEAEQGVAEAQRVSAWGQALGGAASIGSSFYKNRPVSKVDSLTNTTYVGPVNYYQNSAYPASYATPWR